jgi:hypothetical protein
MVTFQVNYKPAKLLLPQNPTTRKEVATIPVPNRKQTKARFVAKNGRIISCVQQLLP